MFERKIKSKMPQPLKILAAAFKIYDMFVAKIWQTTSTDQQIRKGGSQKNTRKLKMQGGRYETKKDGKGGRAPS